MVELVVDAPEALYSRFKRLGVYEKRDVLAIAKGDPAKEVMAFRFDDTELLRPLALKKLQPILKAHGIKTTFQSPVRIPAAVFGELYAAAVNPS